MFPSKTKPVLLERSLHISLKFKCPSLRCQRFALFSGTGLATKTTSSAEYTLEFVCNLSGLNTYEFLSNVAWKIYFPFRDTVRIPCSDTILHPFISNWGSLINVWSKPGTNSTSSNTNFPNRKDPLWVDFKTSLFPTIILTTHGT